MKLIQAIKLLAPYHAAKLVCINPDSHPLPTGQLSTGLADHPFIQVNDGQVCADELYDILILHAEQLYPIVPIQPMQSYCMN